MSQRLYALSSLALATALALAGCGGSGGGSSAGTGAGAATGGSSSTGASAAPLAPTKAKAPVVVKRSGEGFLELNQGKLFAHLKGSPREMGRQYGELLGEKIETLLVTMPAFIRSQNFPAWLLPSITATTAALFRQKFPGDVREYIDGIVEGNRRRNPASFMVADDIIFLSSIVDLGGITNGIITCSTIAAWGPVTRDGKMFQTRCVDLFTGSGIEDNAVVVIEKGTGKIPWANCGWAGMVGSASGMNAHGVAIGQVWAFSDNKAFGEPWVITTRRIMETGQSSDDAVAAFRAVSERTYGSNFVFGDKGDTRGGNPKAYSLESSAHYLAVFEDNDPKEDQALWQGQPYAFKWPNVVLRGDVCLDPGMRSRSTGAGGPHGDPRQANSYKRRYKGQWDVMEQYIQAGIPVGAQEMIDLTRQVATPGGSLQCVVYANSDLEIWVADARRTPGANLDAFVEPYVHYDFDYYLPTVQATLDRAIYLAGDVQTATFTTSTLGSDRDLWLIVRIEDATGGAYLHQNGGVPIPASFRRGRTDTFAQSLLLPQNIPAGQYKLTATLYERGTADVVDVAMVEFQVQ